MKVRASALVVVIACGGGKATPPHDAAPVRIPDAAVRIPDAALAARPAGDVVLPGGEGGIGFDDLMFSPNNPMTAACAEVYCEEAIYKFEPRIERVACRARPNPDEPNRLDIRIEYVIAGKNVERNLVFPFYLKTDEDDAQVAQNGVNGKSADLENA